MFLTFSVFFVSTNDNANIFEILLSSLLPLPIIAFCSCIIDGMEQILDDIIGAIVGYPPKPITTSGFLNKIIIYTFSLIF